MKKCIIYLALALFVLFVFAACGGNNNTDTTPTETGPTHEDTVNQEHSNANGYEMATVRFYYHSTELDPNAELPPESFLYNAEDIPVDNLAEEFIRLMYEHTGVRILDMWHQHEYEGNGVMYIINLHEDAVGFFDHHGTIGGTRNLTIFEKSISSLPGMSAFEVRINGEPGVAGNHFNFNQTTIVQNGEVIDRVFFGTPLPEQHVWMGYHVVIHNTVSPVFNFFAAPSAALPTHMPLTVLDALLDALGLEVISAGRQISVGSSDGRRVEIEVINYLEEFEGLIIGLNDTFMADDFSIHIPIALLREIGLDVHFSGSNAYINSTEIIEPSTSTTNPFAAPLLNFFAGDPGGWEVYNTQTHSSKAFFAHITGSQRTGIIAIRHHNPSGGNPFAVARAFYLVDGEVITRELDIIEGFPFSIAFTPAGRLVQIARDAGNWSDTLFSIDFNETSGGTPMITYDFTIYATVVGEETYEYLRFDGGLHEGFANDGFYIITEEEFNDIRAFHGLDNLTFWGAMPDQTEAILAMRFE